MSLFAAVRRRRMAMKMSCVEVGSVLQQYLDHELDATTSPLVEAHLERCLKCGLEAAVYRDVKEALTAKGELPEDSVRRLRTFGQRIAHGAIPITGED
jgi:predicted anti-sigma-YlaC factor YlaD